MKSYKEEAMACQEQIPLLDFLKFYNKTIPVGFPKATALLLKKFKEGHFKLFKHGELWSLDQHRKKIMDWLPLNGDTQE